MIGSIAGILTTLAFIPQVIKVVKTKDTKSLSLGMYSMQVVGVFLWLIHGIVIRDMALVVANAITFCLSLVILVHKIIYK
ncbi:SemiSWEET transporter [Clostridium intestinale]|jgi:MtN3 and saliva related transmembrane protein|uniref:SemiSWEET transporter n=1 Tax=Clostridium intestinale TaxID=36845 RepID=UPI0028EBB077|nr:SemiSWEET transporter [Clostridium intestinale]